ncbi:P-loop containing nucleoside triphosphate hydrolases superfamily protein [Raphanus sativus]|nr:P-loop containing nucleoside triphosphate hydrolases superfamily protein [Raphanus sativus]
MIVPHPSEPICILPRPPNSYLPKKESSTTLEIEQKSVLFSELGVGVGLGLGPASGQGLGKWANGSVSAAYRRKDRARVVDGRECSVTFDDEKTRHLLTSASYFQLKQFEISKHTRNLATASKAILLSGLAEFNQQMLAKPLAHNFEPKLLLLDVTDFSVKIQRSLLLKSESKSETSVSERMNVPSLKKHM